ncbi:hypothetical protein ACFQ4N_09340 [Oceanobacillus iheyensis]|uniref:hypothetical protein n=1 Tax=Oceanobacillus iheyensis TaxID=182710 RepID=UPI0036396ED5
MEQVTGRNKMDVIMELVQLHFREVYNAGDPVTGEEIEEVYKKYFNLVYGRN